MSSYRIKKHSGFTLVELVVVMVIITILAVTAISFFKRSPSDDIEQARVQALSVLRQIQTTAMQYSTGVSSCGILNVSNTEIIGPIDPTPINGVTCTAATLDSSERSDYLSGFDPKNSTQQLVSFDLKAGVDGISSATTLYFSLLGRPYNRPPSTDVYGQPVDRACMNAPCTLTITSLKDPSFFNEICISSEGYIDEVSAGASSGQGCQ